MTSLLKRLVASRGAFGLATGGLLAGFEFLLCAVVSTIDIPAILDGVMKSIPPFMRGLVGEQFLGGLSVPGILAFGWNHPVLLALGAASAVVPAARAVAGEIENGAIELVLSQPLSRGRYLFGHIFFGLASLALFSLLAAAGTLIGQSVFGIEAFGLGALLAMALNLWLLESALFGITLAFSSGGREFGRAAFAGFLFALVSYVVQVIGQLWAKASFLLPFSLNEYYSPRNILLGKTIPWTSFLVLAAVTGLSLAAAAWRFRRRDVP